MQREPVQDALCAQDARARCAQSLAKFGDVDIGRHVQLQRVVERCRVGGSGRRERRREAGQGGIAQTQQQVGRDVGARCRENARGRALRGKPGESLPERGFVHEIASIGDDEIGRAELARDRVAEIGVVRHRPYRLGIDHHDDPVDAIGRQKRHGAGDHAGQRDTAGFQYHALDVGPLLG